jgi:hypothetical protein
MSKAKKRLLIIFGIITLFIVILIFSLNGIVAGIIENKVDAFLEKHPVKHYRLTYDRVGFNLVNRSVRIVGLTYTPDKSYLDSLENSGFSHMVPQIKVGKFIVTGIGISDAIQDKVIKINHVKIKKVFVTLYKIKGDKPAEKKVKPEKKKSTSVIPDSVKIKGINGIVINNILLNKSKVEIVDVKENNKILENDEMIIDISNIVLEKSKFNNDYLYTDVGDIRFEIRNNVFRTGDGLYEIAFDKLYTNKNDELITIKNFKFKPLYTKNDFTKQLKYQQERYDIKAKELLITQPDFEKLFADNELHIEKVIVKSPDIGIYRDKRIPFPHFKRPLLPHQAIKKMKMNLEVDTVLIENAKFAYEELTDRNVKPLYISFNDLEGVISNVCNIKDKLKTNNKMRLSLRGKMMKAAPFELQFVFPMKARNDTFVFWGAVYGKVPLKIFNKAVHPASGITFDDGYLDKLTFKGGANPVYSKGEMTMLYHDLALTVDKKEKEGQNKFLSWGATAAVRKNNPIEGKPPKTAVMFYERDIEKGFGNFLWKTIFSGLKATMIISVNSMNKKKYKALTTPKNSDGNKKKKKWPWKKKK